MLTQDVIDALLVPISEGSSCGDDLEYDAAFIALESAAKRKPEQQFGDTVIAAVEPEWQRVQEQAIAMLKRSKDVRLYVLLLRSGIRQQGLDGFVDGIRLLRMVLDGYWDGVHPQLDADDDNDPTMRLNALAPLSDDSLVIRDLHDVVIGDARGIGPIRVRDIAIARNLLGAATAEYSTTQVEGAVQEILSANSAIAHAMRSAGAELAQLQQSIETHSGRENAVDFSRLRDVCKLLKAMAGNAAGLPGDPLASSADQPATVDANAASAFAAHPASKHNGAITTRQDALDQLDRVIQFLQQTEPGNPAPLLIQRAKKLIGVSFLEIINDLAPDALSAIEQVTGARAPSE